MADSPQTLHTNGKPQPVGWAGMLTSILFYLANISLGSYLLYRGMTSTSMQPSFVFVLIVLGVAVFLFGTGSQAAIAYSLNHGKDSAALSVSIVGGAAALTFLTAFGIITEHQRIKVAFADNIRYGAVRIPFDNSEKPHPNGVVAEYFVRARSTRTAEEFPVVRRDSSSWILIPYENIYNENVDNRNSCQEQSIEITYTIAPRLRRDLNFFKSEGVESLFYRCDAEQKTQGGYGIPVRGRLVGRINVANISGQTDKFGSRSQTDATMERKILDVDGI